MSTHFRAKITLRSNDDFGGVDLFSENMGYEEALDTHERLREMLPPSLKEMGLFMEHSIVDRRGHTVTARRVGGRGKVGQ